MQDFLKKLGTKAKSTIKDFFTVTPEEEAKGKKPDVVEKTTKTVGDFFAPVPDKVRVRDVVREVPGTAGKMAVDIARSIPRSILSTALTVAPKSVRENIGEIRPEEDFGTLGKVLLGDERIQTIPLMGKETLESFGAGEETAKRYGPLAGFALTAADLFPGTSGKGKMATEAFETLAKTTKPAEVKTILKSFGFAKKEIDDVAEAIVKATTADDVKAVLGVTDNVAPKAGKGAQEAVSRETPVTDIRDAKNYKSSEEFVKAKNTYPDGISNGSMEPHAYLPLKEVYPGEYDTWKEVMDLKDNVYTSGKVKDTSKAILVRKYPNSEGFAIEDGHHRTANFIKENAIKDPETSEIKIPVYFDADTLDKIWKIQNEIKPSEKMSNTYDILARELGQINASRGTNTVARETPKGTGTMRSIGEILQDGGKGTVPPEVRAPKGTAPKGEPERRFITRTKEMAPEMSDLLKGKYTPKSNKELVANAEKLIKEDYLTAENMARTGVDDQSVAIANKLIEDELNIARKATDEATKNKAYALAAEIANDAAKNLTEAGRAVQAASLLGKMTPEGMARYAARQIQKYNEQAGARTVKNFLGGAKKIPELTGDQLKEITDAMEAINKMEDGTDKARALQKLGEKIQSYIPSTLYQKVINVWKAGLLTGLKTTGVNIASNLSHSISEVAKDVPASAVDAIVSLFTGKRTLALTGKGAGKGAAEGVAKGWDYLKTGFDERNIADKLDYKKVNFGKGPVAKALKGYTDTVFGLLGAEDQPFYYAAKMRSLANQASAMAKNEGLKGKAARDFAQKLIENPTDDMMKYATLDAETAVFQQDSWLAKKAQNLQKGLEIVLPFAKTPANVANAMINYSPVGIVKTIIENIGKGRFDQRLFSQGIGRGITGTAALAIGSALMGNKMMNLSWPTSEKEREQWELEGRLPNTIMIGGKWRNIGVLGPLGMVLIVGGHMKQGMEETGSFAGGLAQAAGGFGNALTEQSFLSGVNRAIDALKDPKRSFNGFASSLAGSVVPTLIADIARGMDQYERRTDGMIERIQSRIPGARQGLEPKVDAFGKKVETPNLFEVLADPTRPGNPTAEANDPVLKELRRLMDADYPVTPTQLGPTAGYESLAPELNTKLWQTSGMYVKKEIERVMNSRQYDRYDDEQKSQVLDRAIQDAKTEARARIVIDALKGLSDSEQKSKLAQMKDEGLLTRSVFDLYLSLKRKQ